MATNWRQAAQNKIWEYCWFIFKNNWTQPRLQTRKERKSGKEYFLSFVIFLLSSSSSSFTWFYLSSRPLLFRTSITITSTTGYSFPTLHTHLSSSLFSWFILLLSFSSDGPLCSYQILIWSCSSLLSSPQSEHKCSKDIDGRYYNSE